MGVHMKTKQLRRRVVGVALATAALALGSLVAPSAASAAGPACPSTAVPTGEVGYWVQEFSARGVTLCAGHDNTPYPNEFIRVRLQIIDLAAGATIDVRSEYGVADPLHFNDAAYDKYQRKYLTDWATQFGVGSPETSGTFSVTNASFFNDTSAPSTTITMPFSGYPYSSGTPGTMTYPGDQNAGLQKRVLRSNSSSTTQVSSFPTQYTTSDFFNQCYNWQSCVVGFGPLDDPDFNNPGSSNARTYVGTNAVWNASATKAYILTGVGTVTEANRIMQHVGAISIVQLDGGGSTGTETASNDWKQDGYPVIQREVPNVLVVRYAP
jgi:hypothetical protein